MQHSKPHNTDSFQSAYALTNVVDNVPCINGSVHETAQGAILIALHNPTQSTLEKVVAWMNTVTASTGHATLFEEMDLLLQFLYEHMITQDRYQFSAKWSMWCQVIELNASSHTILFLNGK
jgi:hypothetical protein